MNALNKFGGLRKSVKVLGDKPGTSVPRAPFGSIFLSDNDSAILTDIDGARITEAV
ncbi:hypothetical protein [Rhizobium rhizosphaerae]|uniref:hypothetical protein n=1 Tax=Xaviernesmea rhizosphaerae TaxID=1672749 RepID=UPI000AEEA3B2|nr:hypothetical protein [Xaviernesmea rhizosphaerae]